MRGVEATASLLLAAGFPSPDGPNLSGPSVPFRPSSSTSSSSSAAVSRAGCALVALCPGPPPQDIAAKFYTVVSKVVIVCVIRKRVMFVCARLLRSRIGTDRAVEAWSAGRGGGLPRSAERGARTGLRRRSGPGSRLAAPERRVGCDGDLASCRLPGPGRLATCRSPVRERSVEGYTTCLAPQGRGGGRL